MKKLAVIVCIVCLSSMAFGWGQATHAYINTQLHKGTGGNVLDEIYGGNSPDIFNYVFQLPLESQQRLYMATHREYAMLVYANAHSQRERAFAYGFMTHNDKWGADATAHHNGITFGQDSGYVIAKARILAAYLQADPRIQALGLQGQALEDICHQLVENAIDIMMTDMDPAIGARLITAATNRTPQAPELLVRAYAQAFGPAVGGNEQAAALIRAAEDGFRKETVLYGSALTQDKETARQLIAAQLAQMTPAFMQMYGINIDPALDLQPMVADMIGAAMMICADDYRGEVNATVVQVRNNMQTLGVTY